MTDVFANLAPVADGGAAIITSAAGGIGLAAARRFAGLGMPVFIADLPGERLCAAEVAIRDAGGRVTAVSADMSDPRALESLRDRALGEFGHIGVVMLNPDSGPTPGEVSCAPEDWRARVDANVWAAISCVRAFLPAMLDAGRAGYLIASRPIERGASENPSEAVLKTFMEATRQGLRQVTPCGITAHLLTPGLVVGDNASGERSAGTPTGASTPEQVVEFMLDALDWGDFHIRPRRAQHGHEFEHARGAWRPGLARR